MPFKRKPVVTVGTRDWEVLIPNPPKHATHARMVCVDPLSPSSTPKKATLPIQDFGCFKGVSGRFQYIRMDKTKRVIEEYEGSWYWDGTQVEGIDLLAKNI